MIAVDASALCAIALHEPERQIFYQAVKTAGRGWFSPLGRWEAVIAIDREMPGEGEATVEGLIALLRLEIAQIGHREADLAIEAWRRFGKGRHPARLNLGDCFAYALAKSRDLPLLYKGDDFSKTDVRRAL